MGPYITVDGVEMAAEVYHMRLVCLRQAMKFELQTGMKMPGLKRNQNPFQIAREDFGIKKRAKQAVYDEFTRIVGDPVEYVRRLIEEQHGVEVVAVPG